MFRHAGRTFNVLSATLFVLGVTLITLTGVTGNDQASASDRPAGFCPKYSVTLPMLASDSVPAQIQAQIRGTLDESVTSDPEVIQRLTDNGDNDGTVLLPAARREAWIKAWNEVYGSSAQEQVAATSTTCATATVSPTPTRTPTVTGTASSTATPGTATGTSTPSQSPTATISVTTTQPPTSTSTLVPTPTNTTGPGTPTSTTVPPTSTPTSTAIPTNTPTQTPTPTATAAPVCPVGSPIIYDIGQAGGYPATLPDANTATFSTLTAVPGCKIQIEVSATSDPTPINRVRVIIYASGIDAVSPVMTLVSGTGNDGTWTYEWTVPAGTIRLNGVDFILENSSTEQQDEFDPNTPSDKYPAGWGVYFLRF